MAEPSRNMEVERLISYTDDLVKVLVEPRDLNNLSYCHQQNLSLSSSSHSHHHDVRSSLQDCEKKVDACKQKIEEARSETVTDAELDLLQRELEEDLEKERLLKEEFRAIGEEFNDLEQQWISVQEQKKTLKKIEKTKLRAQMILSMYASVTNIVPDLGEQSKISGYIVDKDKDAVEKFDYDTSKMTDFDICNGVWKIISE
ncbi:kinetochore protein SPC24 homolog [Vigna unguiculata]|uniref:kinetochore protein SPC24 homolog n=1 Tax=Vigna unguiculata TaxID=3917 RepID=UPI0010168EF5|nr:kinetochore protein SPC24 homolog [Vigna unguiculata]